MRRLDWDQQPRCIDRHTGVPILRPGRAVIRRNCNVRSAVRVDITYVHLVVGINTDGGVAAAGAVGNCRISPRYAIVARNRDTLAATRPRGTGRIWNVDGAVGTHFDVTVNATVALSRSKDVDSGTKGETTIIAARTFRAAHDVL